MSTHTALFAAHSLLLASAVLTACGGAEPKAAGEGPTSQDETTSGSAAPGETPAAGSSAAAAGVASAVSAGRGVAAGGGAAGQSGSSGSAAGAAAGTGAGGNGAAGKTAGAAGEGAVGNITVWIAGDSTVANGSTPCPIGWGADFQSHFSDKAKVVNSAVGGRSVRTWLYNVQTTMGSDGECLLAQDQSGMPTLQARWQQMLDGMKSGDYLFIQFGINDSSATCDRHVGLEAFKASYGMMAKAAKNRGAQAIFVTPVSSISCKGNTAQGTRGGYVTATQQAGEQSGVPVIDLHARSVALYTALELCPIPGGGDVSASTTGKTGSFFCEDHTHFERTGAEQIGQLIVDELRAQHIGLEAYLK